MKPRTHVRFRRRPTVVDDAPAAPAASSGTPTRSIDRFRLVFLMDSLIVAKFCGYLFISGSRVHLLF
jgi:hypothetical protein